jgi:Icc-related predicted phosphoesterase
MSIFGWKSRRVADGRTTRLFFGSDFHGSERTFRKFINAAKHYDADVLIMGGDIVGKLAIPIIREGRDGYRAHLMGRTEHLQGEDQLTGLLDRLATLGYYSRIMAEDEYRALRADPPAVERLFHELARARLESWLELAEARLAGTGKRCYVIGGNDDDPEVLETLKRGTTAQVVYCEDRQVEIDEDHSMISVGFSNPTPWKTPREVPDETIGAAIEQLAAGVGDFGRCIFNIHVPPKDSTLDTCPELDWSTDPPSQIAKGGQVVLYGAGSAAVRSAIEAYQPLLSLHGHIHESGGAVRLGRTLSVNPGSEYGEGVLRGCLITLARDQVKSHQLTAG